MTRCEQGTQHDKSRHDMTEQDRTEQDAIGETEPKETVLLLRVTCFINSSKSLETLLICLLGENVVTSVNQWSHHRKAHVFITFPMTSH